MAAVTSQATNSPDTPLVGFGTNEWIVDEMYQRYLTDPASVDPAWHDFFADYKPQIDKSAPTTMKAPAKAAPAATPATTGSSGGANAPRPAPTPARATRHSGCSGRRRDHSGSGEAVQRRRAA